MTPWIMIPSWIFDETDPTDPRRRYLTDLYWLGRSGAPIAASERWLSVRWSAPKSTVRRILRAVETKGGLIRIPPASKGAPGLIKVISPGEGSNARTTSGPPPDHLRTNSNGPNSGGAGNPEPPTDRDRTATGPKRLDTLDTLNRFRLTNERDDLHRLKSIKMIGDRVVRCLRAANITTVEGVDALPPQALREIVGPKSAARLFDWLEGGPRPLRPSDDPAAAQIPPRPVEGLEGRLWTSWSGPWVDGDRQADWGRASKVWPRVISAARGLIALGWSPPQVEARVYELALWAVNKTPRLGMSRPGTDILAKMITRDVSTRRAPITQPSPNNRKGRSGHERGGPNRAGPASFLTQPQTNKTNIEVIEGNFEEIEQCH